MTNDSLGDRMKRYEAVSTAFFPRRVPLIVRVDGRAFHTLTSGMKKPFDPGLIEAMVHGALCVASDMQGFCAAYVQSDEASFFLQDWAKLDTESWFGKSLNKVVSLSASMMSVQVSNLLKRSAYFDARAFVLPESEVANYFLWRAKDWNRNSLSMFAQAHFSHRSLQGAGHADMHGMLHAIGKNWTLDLSEVERNGTFLLREGNGIVRRTDILPSWKDVSEAIESTFPLI